jgi:hypothetical protein
MIKFFFSSYTGAFLKFCFICKYPVCRQDQANLSFHTYVHSSFSYLHTSALICINIHGHSHSIALITIWSILRFQQSVPSQFPTIQNLKTISSTESKSSIQNWYILKPGIHTGVLSKLSTRISVSLGGRVSRPLEFSLRADHPSEFSIPISHF